MTIREPAVADIDGQKVLLPTWHEWRDILAEGVILGQPVPLPELAAGALEELGRHPEAIFGLVRRRPEGPLTLLPLLVMDGEYFRVHFEDIICEHCGRRGGMSAKPESVEYAGTGISGAAVWAKFARLGLRACPHCGEVLRRRQTVWLAAECKHD